MDTARLRDKAEFLALENMLVIFIRALRQSAPAVYKDLEYQLQSGGQLLGLVHPAGAPAETGDALMGELQDAWERLCAKALAEP